MTFVFSDEPSLTGRENFIHSKIHAKLLKMWTKSGIVMNDSSSSEHDHFWQ